MQNEDFSRPRQAMVQKIRAHGVADPDVLRAMGKVKRHRFIPEAHRALADAYGDHPCPIGYGQTISQPFIVGYMTEKMAIKPGEIVLEVGTGSGYQAAILDALGAEVFSVEIIPELADHARRALEQEGYGGVRVRTGDGYEGWPENGPFDVVIVTCAPDKVPRALTEQLAEGGRMIVPVGVGVQRLVILRKVDGKIVRQDDIAVRFVPMVHEKSDPN